MTYNLGFKKYIYFKPLMQNLSSCEDIIEFIFNFVYNPFRLLCMQDVLTNPSTAVSLIFFSLGFSKVISGKIFEFRITLRDPAVLMIMRDVTVCPVSACARRSFSLSWPLPLSTHVELSKMYS